MKKLTWILLLFVALTDALGAAADSYIGEPNCQVYNPVPQERERVTWTGGCKDGYADGEGILQWYQDDRPGSRFEGRLKRGLRDGPGTQFFIPSKTPADAPNVLRKRMECVAVKEIVLRATFVQGQPVGDVEWISGCGSLYRGEWRDARPNGLGTIHYFDDVDYEGNFVDGQRDGKGTARYSNGDRYEGLWRKGNFDGVGVLRYANGSSYEGNFRNGLFDGAGVLVGAHGQRLAGEFKNGDLQLDHALAIPKWLPLAESGDPIGQTGLAVALLATSRSQADDQIGLHWLALAIDQGHLPALKRLAMYYVDQRAVMEGETLAQYWHRYLQNDASKATGTAATALTATSPSVEGQQEANPNNWLPVIEKEEASRNVCVPDLPDQVNTKELTGPMTVRLLLDSDGFARDGRIEQRSGNDILDRSTLSSVFGCRLAYALPAIAGTAPWRTIKFLWK